MTSAEFTPTQRTGVNQPRPNGLQLRPFRAVRYSPDLVHDLAAVTSPPYDVIGDAVSRWESTHPYNVVRLILPRDEGNSDSRYRHAARDLRTWMARGILRRDTKPALYVYEQRRTTTLLSRGLIGCVSLHRPEERVVLPHEEVFPGPVADRAALMVATGAQLEPITLVYDGGGAASDVVDHIAAAEPQFQATDSDGVEHRLWQLTSQDLQAEVAADLVRRQALIADGHHRYAAYLRLRDKFGTDSPWSTGLAMLIDGSRHPLQLGAIHRCVAQLSLDEAVTRVRRGFRQVLSMAPGAARHALADARRDGVSVLLTDGEAWWRATGPEPALMDAAVNGERSSIYRSLDAAIVNSLLLGDLLGVPDTHDRVTYHHDAESAVSQSRASAGVAILLNPPSLEDVLAVTAGGERMPRKSTSFGPKPRTGLVLRLVEPG